MIEHILEADRYLQVDQVDKARDMYQRVVELDPGNAIAVVGLARCALADGDDHEAYALATRALRIDPEDDMARRMEARLSEVLATRGEPVERPPEAAMPSPREMRPVVTAEGPPADPVPTTAPAADSTRSTPSATRPTSTSNQARERPVRKSFLDRLRGR